MADFLGDVMNSVQSQVNSSLSTMVDFMDNFQSGTDFSLDFDKGPEVEAAVNGLMIGVGALLVLFGCRLFRATLFALVTIATAGLIYYIGVKNGQEQRVMFPVAACLGVFCGLLSIKLWKLAMFLVGFAVALVGYVVVKSLNPNLLPPNALLAGMLCLGIVFGVMSVYMERYWLLLTTPILGSFIFAQGVNFFAQLDIDVFGTLAGKSRCTTQECYGLWAGTASFALVGMLIQYRFTAGFDHKTTTHKKERYVKQLDVV